jgi:hypothetical protein
MQAFTADSGVPAAALEAGALDAGALLAGALDATAGALDDAAAGALDAAAGALLAAAGALADALVLELELDLLLLHAATAMTTIPVAATIWTVLLTMPPPVFAVPPTGRDDPRTIGARTASVQQPPTLQPHPGV